MRRTSALVTSIRQALRDSGVTVTARRIEGWASADLLPSPRLPLELQLDHYLSLARLSGKGTDADTTALRLAANGFTCGRLRPALIRYFNITEPKPMPRLDLGPSESADAAFALVEETAREMEAQFLEVAPTALGKIFKALQRNASKFAQRAGAADDGDTGESLFHSALVNAGCYFFGGEVYNAKAGAATINASPQDVDETDLDLVNSLVHMNPEQIDRAYLELPAEQVVAMASLLRKGAPGVLSYLGLETMSESEVDEVCAVVVPMLVYAVGLFREHLCGPELEALMPALAVMDGGHALSA